MEIFVCSDLSGFSDLQHVIINVFSSPTEEVRSAASYALGKSHVTKLLLTNCQGIPKICAYMT